MGELFDNIHELETAEAQCALDEAEARARLATHVDRYTRIQAAAGIAACELTAMGILPDVRITDEVIRPPRGSLRDWRGRPRPGIVIPGTLLGEGWSVVQELRELHGTHPTPGAMPGQKHGTVVTPHGTFADFNRVTPRFDEEELARIARSFELPIIVNRRREQLVSLIRTHGIDPTLFRHL